MLLDHTQCWMVQFEKCDADDNSISSAYGHGLINLFAAVKVLKAQMQKLNNAT